MHAVVLFLYIRYTMGMEKGTMSVSEMGRRGAAATNKIYTTEKRKRAARKGWRTRKQKLKAQKIK